MRKILAFLIASVLATTAYALGIEDDNEIGTDAPEPAGFLTQMLNNAIEKSVDKTPADAPMQYGRNVTKWASAPKFGGYVIGSYKYSDVKNGNGGEGFNCRLVRLYLDGTILKDFKYRLQVEMNGDLAANKSPHIKDFFLAWSHWKELEIKIGQFKRCFTFENPYNPWDVGVGDYSQLTKKLSGFSDYSGGEASNNGGRDLGIQLQGDLFKVGKTQHNLVHYQVAMYNGQGINHGDANKRNDFMGTIQFQPIKDLYIGVFGWTGNATYNNITVNRKRYAIGVKYEHNGWSARAEYAHHKGQKISDYTYDEDSKTQILKSTAGNGKADAWYATVGVPCTSWLKMYLKYDAYRDAADNASLSSIYSVCANFQLHKNILLQAQYNYVNNKLVANSRANQLWAQVYFRF